MLIEAEERQRRRGVLLCLTGLNPTTLDVIRKSSLGTTLGDERMFFNVNGAVQHYLEGGLTETRTNPV